VVGLVDGVTDYRRVSKRRDGAKRGEIETWSPVRKWCDVRKVAAAKLELSDFYAVSDKLLLQVFRRVFVLRFDVV